RAYSQFSRTSTIFSSPLETRSFTSFAERRPNGSAGAWRGWVMVPFPSVPTGYRADRRTIIKSMKLLSLDEAIARFVPDGASVAMGTALESLIPFAAGHELIRQQRSDLELIGPISDMLFDQLI